MNLKFYLSPFQTIPQDEYLVHAQLRVPHSRIQVELCFILQAGTCQILNFAQNPTQSQSIQMKNCFTQQKMKTS